MFLCFIGFVFLLFGLCFFVVGLFLVLFFFGGGFKGQVRWPKGPPHLALNPLYVLGGCVTFLSVLFL